MHRHSKYVYTPASTLSAKYSIANSSSKELRRQVGENQSITNYFASDSYKDKQSKLYRPLIDSMDSNKKGTEDLLKAIASNNGNISNALTNQQKQQKTLLDFLQETMIEHNKNIQETLKQKALGKQETTNRISDEVIQKYSRQIAQNNKDEHIFFELIPDGPYGRMPVFDYLGLSSNCYIELAGINDYTDIRCHKDNESLDLPITLELLEVLVNRDQTRTTAKVKEDYMKIVDFMIGDLLLTLANSFNEEYVYDNFKLDAAQTIYNLWYKFSEKFKEWILPEYKFDISNIRRYIDQALHDNTADVKLPVKEEADANVEQEQKITEEIQKPFGSVTTRPERLHTDGKGIETKPLIRPKYKVIVIARNAEDRLQRLKVLLGSNNAGNNTGLDEYTSILDSLLKDGKIDKKGYKRYLKLWKK